MTSIKQVLRRISTDFFGPEIVRIYPVGYLCNHSCPMCWRANNVSDDKKKELISLERTSLSLTEYINVLDTLPPGVEVVELVGGGEPLMYKDIIQLTAEIKKRNLKGSLITNGVLLREDLAKHLVKIGWDKIRFSVHGSNQVFYRFVNGVNSFNVAVKNIQRLIEIRDEVQGKQKKTKVGVLSVIQKTNFQDVYDFGKLFDKIKCDFIQFDTLFAYEDKNRLDLAQVKSVIKQLARVIKEVSVENNARHTLKLYLSHPNAAQNRSKVRSRYYQAKKCQVPTDSLVIDSLGEIHPCCFLDSSEIENVAVGSLRKTQNIWKIWLNKEYMKKRQAFRRGEFMETCTNRCNYELPNRL